MKASGFSKEIQEFDEILDEMEQEENENGHEKTTDSETDQKPVRQERDLNTSEGACSSAQDESVLSHDSALNSSTAAQDINDPYVDELADQFDSELCFANNKVNTNFDLFQFCFCDFFDKLIFNSKLTNNQLIFI